jgi:hypothetical protein
MSIRAARLMLSVATVMCGTPAAAQHRFDPEQDAAMKAEQARQAAENQFEAAQHVRSRPSDAPIATASVDSVLFPGMRLATARPTTAAASAHAEARHQKRAKRVPAAKAPTARASRLAKKRRQGASEMIAKATLNR